MDFLMELSRWGSRGGRCWEEQLILEKRYGRKRVDSPEGLMTHFFASWQ